MKISRVGAVVFGVVVATGLVRAGAEQTRRWRQASYEEFEKGTAKGVALRSDGTLRLAPKFAPVADPNLAYLWALKTDSKGNLYAAGGTSAKVVKLDAAGAISTVFESSEMAAQAVVLDEKDNLYVATSPDGKVYKVTTKGEKAVFFEPKTKYIWDLALSADGTLYVATGDKGEVFAVSPEGKGAVYYQSQETHVRSLALDAKGALILGTEPSGMVVRLTKAARGEAAPQAFVLYETSKKEITALITDRSGNIYAAAVGEKPRPAPALPAFPVQPAPAPAPAPSQVGQQLAAGIGPATFAQQPTTFVPFPPAVGGAVYRIAADGSPAELWNSREELVYTLGLSAPGKLLLGTGNRGTILQLEGNDVHSILVKTSSLQVTALVAGPGGKVYAATANPGKVFALGPEDEAEGTFESQPFDARIYAQWGRIEWWGEGAGAAKDAKEPPIAIYVRAGNTSNPEANWSPWAGPYTTASGEKVNVPAARFAQWKTVLKNRGATPSLSWVSLAYLRKNLAPTVEAIVVQNPNVRVQGFVQPQTDRPGQQAVQLKQPTLPGDTSALRAASTRAAADPAQPERPASRFEAPPQGFAAKGYRSVLWSAQDENGDELSYSVFYRGEGEKSWKALKEKIEQRFFSWDSSTMPDGAYYLKILASDEPSNPPADALQGERISERFEVDNTPPVVDRLRAEVTGTEANVLFEARDPSSAIARAEYSVDAGEWILVFPVGRLSDAPQASYKIVLPRLAPGEHTVVVRAFDQFENMASAKVTFVMVRR